MKKMLYRLIVLLVPVVLLLFAYGLFRNWCLKKMYGPSTEQQITRSFYNALNRDYNCLILGNSRIYRGINPDRFPFATYNFAHDNDSFNQCYYKLRYLQNNNKHLTYLILGVDYFELSFISDSRNYVYNQYFDADYHNDYPRPKLLVFDDKQFSTFISRHYSHSLWMILYGYLTKDYKQGYLKDNGQYLVKGVAKESDSVKRIYARLPVQEKYLDRILANAYDNNIIVFLLMPPARENELRNYPESVKNEFNEMFRKKASRYGFYYLNYSDSNNFTITDFQDITHLNISGADKFSDILGKDMVNILSARRNRPQ